jgi:hypothetical protein
MAPRGISKYDPRDPEASRIALGLRAAGMGSGNTTSQVRQTVDPNESYKKSIEQASDYQVSQAMKNYEAMMSNFLKGFSGGGTAANADDLLAKRKYEDELAKERRSIDAYRNMLSSGGYRSGMDTLLGMIGTEGGRQTGEVNKAYNDALANIAAGYGQAQQTTDVGFNTLNQFLRQNPNNPYANVQVSAGAAPDAMEQILSAYGVSADPVRAQVSAEQAAAQQGAAGFQNLLDVLGASAQQSDLSRLAESQMAQRLAGESLAGQQAGLRAQASRAQADALSAIQAQLAQARLEQEANAVARRQSIEDAIVAAGGQLPVPAAAAAASPAATPAATPAVAAPAVTQIGSPGVKGGTPDYLRVIAEQMARPQEPKKKKKKK